ncbi:protein kinase domain-containing protein [Paenibacillus silvisoli]|uniref:protein kinase domain-containing protein n=1 Tax=Paenibacillus silvisoli TaxID=3110539 RepID=UPI00280527B0|nr:serine/threonine protein kinase [Paenibacillus silvisoli]
MITKTIDEVAFDLKEDFDFTFLSEYGRVFAVFDQQDSGNLCFGVQGRDKKLFLKLAGAATMLSNVSAEEAIARLKSTIRIYEHLSHPSLIQIHQHKEIAGGYLTVFDWFDGECMGRQYQSYDRFIALPVEDKLRIFETILNFHEHVHACGYIALDFYDGSIMYDFQSKHTMLCDIEFYRPMPVMNTMGRMWGSSRYMSPEELQLGAQIDERSNVFVMGATAFQLFGGGVDRSIEKWEAGERLHAIASKAVQLEKNERYPSIGELHEAWTAAVNER